MQVPVHLEDREVEWYALQYSLQLHPPNVCMYVFCFDLHEGACDVHNVIISSALPEPCFDFRTGRKRQRKKKCGISDLESANFCMPNKPLLVTHPTINIQRSPFVSNDVKLNKQLQWIIIIEKNKKNKNFSLSTRNRRKAMHKKGKMR